jgi:hypothetical protein
VLRVAKASFDTHPIFHQSDAAIRGHVFVSFLALTLAKELTRLCQEKGSPPPNGSRSSTISIACRMIAAMGGKNGHHDQRTAEQVANRHAASEDSQSQRNDGGGQAACNGPCT